MLRLLIPLVLAGVAHADTIQITTPTVYWNLNISNPGNYDSAGEDFTKDLVFDLSSIPAGSHFTGAVFSYTQTTRITPQSFYLIHCTFTDTLIYTITAYGERHICSEQNYNEAPGDFWLDYRSSVGGFGGNSYNFVPFTNAFYYDARIAALQPIFSGPTYTATLSTSLGGFFSGWIHYGNNGIPPTPAWTASAQGQGAATLLLTYDPPPASVTTTPEPSTFALVGLALAGLIWKRRSQLT